MNVEAMNLITAMIDAYYDPEYNPHIRGEQMTYGTMASEDKALEVLESVDNGVEEKRYENNKRYED